ncbi:MAG: molybdopterin molybdotransferase MoeA [Crocinitomicaceae bacterium]|nr:molybdopterin molybdotransferase MoeA [Crocinitomicaceae bacterium]
MINVNDAIALVDKTANISVPVEMELIQALDHVLGEDIYSPINMPPFDQSAMDGFAVNFDSKITTYKVIGEIPAGSGELFELQKGEAVRIFTGAAVPNSANTVVQQEIVSVEGNTITFTEEIKENSNIRPFGEQIKTGELAIEKGTHLTPGAIGFIATLGITKVKVHPNPTVAILTTGNELVKPGNPLTFGKVYESNSLMLEAAFRAAGIKTIKHVAIEDDYEKTEVAIRDAFKEYDLLILSGGISVGEYDFVGKALLQLGVEQIFYKVNQKPGKPLFFGKKENKLVFALPGNPAAALTSFYVYILPTLNKMAGKGFRGCREIEARLTHSFIKKGSRAGILKAQACNDEVVIMGAQSSAMLSSFANANALVIIPSETTEIKKGEKVKTLLLP